MGEKRGVYRVLVGKPEGKGPLGRPRRRWEDNIKMDINPLNAELNPICHLLTLLGAHHIFHVSGLMVKEVGSWGMDWIDLPQDRDRWRALVNEVMNLRVP